MNERLAKSEWGPGPWQDEPDRLEFKYRGVQCLVVRNTWVSGSLCGYVGVTGDHPWYGRHYDTVEAGAGGIEVHGGLTYSGACSGHICHQGEPRDVWWVGFDTAHFMDRMPLLDATMKEIHARAREEGYDDPRDVVFKDCVYRDIEYVKGECKRLAVQSLKARPLKERARFWWRVVKGIQWYRLRWRLGRWWDRTRSEWTTPED